MSPWLLFKKRFLTLIIKHLLLELCATEISPQNMINSPEIDPSAYERAFNQWGKGIRINTVRTTWETKQDPHHIPHTKINSKWDLNVKYETTEENMGNYFITC